MKAQKLTVGDVLLELAQADISRARLVELRAHPSARVRVAVAKHPRVDDATLIHLESDSADIVRLAAALGACGRGSLEEHFARSGHRWVRAILAHAPRSGHPQLSHATQHRLAADEFWEVRARVAETTAYRDVYDRLLNDPRPDTRGRCAANPRADREDIGRLLADRAWTTRSATVAHGLRYPDDEQLVQAAGDRSVHVRWQILYRAGVPQRIVQLLLDDPDEMNRNAAHSSRWEFDAEAQAIAMRESETADPEQLRWLET